MNLFIQIILLILSFLVCYSLSYFILTEDDKYKKIKIHLLKPYNLKDFVKRSLFGVVGAFLTNEILIRVFYESNTPIDILKISLFIYIILALIGLIYLSIYDLEYFEIPDLFSLVLLIYLAVPNIVLMFLNKSIVLWNSDKYVPLSNILAALVAGGFILFLVLVTKGRGMGEGDIRIAAILGLFLGFDKLIVGFYMTIFSAAIIGILVSIKMKKMHGVQIPFVPFIVFGTISAFLYSSEILSFVTHFFLV